MDVCVDDVLSRSRPKVKALLRLKPFYSTSDLVRQFKTHILPLLEGCNAAIYHGSDSVLQRLDHALSSFASKLNLSPVEAFLTYNLAPLREGMEEGTAALLRSCRLSVHHCLEFLRSCLSLLRSFFLYCWCASVSASLHALQALLYSGVLWACCLAWIAWRHLSLSHGWEEVVSWRVRDGMCFAVEMIWSVRA